MDLADKTFHDGERMLATAPHTRGDTRASPPRMLATLYLYSPSYPIGEILPRQGFFLLETRVRGEPYDPSKFQHIDTNFNGTERHRKPQPW
jgi:hypothetical protein